MNEFESLSVFVSCAADDVDNAFPIINVLRKAGYNVWFDFSTEQSSASQSIIFDYIQNCSYFLALISRAYLSHEKTVSDVYAAMEQDNILLVVYIDDVELGEANLGFEMHFNSKLSRSIRISDYDSCDELVSSLFTGEEVRSERKPEVKKHNKSFKKTWIAILLIISVVYAFASEIALKEAMIAGNSNSEEITELPEEDSVLASYSWTELKAIAEEIAAAENYDESLAIAKSYGLVNEEGKLAGGIKLVELTDRTKAPVCILGFRHDDKTDGNAAGITFEFVSCPTMHCMNQAESNTGGWERCEMRDWLNHSFFESLPEELRSSIVSVKKKTNNQGMLSEEDTSSVTVTDDKIWLLSYVEVFGELSSQNKMLPLFPAVYDAEGNQYKLYSDQGIWGAGNTFCEKRGSYGWWLRSPCTYMETSFHFVDNYSGYDAHNPCDCEIGVAPAFCI